MGEFMRLDEWDDFTEIASGCTNVFYQTTDRGSEVELIAYAARVYWKCELEKDTLKDFIDDLKTLRGKRVLETSDNVFR